MVYSNDFIDLIHLIEFSEISIKSLLVDYLDFKVSLSSICRRENLILLITERVALPSISTRVSLYTLGIIKRLYSGVLYKRQSL